LPYAGFFNLFQVPGITMNPGEKHKILFVVNPISGVHHKHFDEFRNKVEEVLDSTLFEPIFELTGSEGHATQLVKHGLNKGITHFVAVGGDGTLNEVAKPLIGTDAIMGVIPAGSGNGLAHHMKVPVRLSEAVKVLNKLKVISIDTCLINDRHFLSIAGIGFDATVARHYAKVQQRGFLTYARMAAKEYFRYKPSDYLLIIDGQKRDVSAFFISFANSNQFGYNAMIAPHASLIDGKIDVCIASRPPVIAFPGLLHRVVRKKIDESRYIETIRATEIKVRRTKGKTVNVDGEAVKMSKKLHVKIRPASLNMIVP
jgi:YegS/Rv2252/BmrU family lipid kinase